MKVSIKKIVKYVGITLGVIVLLLILATLSLRLPYVQNLVKDEVISFVEDKIGTPVSLDKIYVNFPNELEMTNFYLEGQEQDTIIKVDYLKVGLNLWDLIDNQANLTSIEVENLIANVKRDEQGTFNFDYIVDAFATPDDPNKDSKPFILNLNEIDLKNIRVNYDDRITKNNINVDFKEFQTIVKEFDLDKNSYALGNVSMDGLQLKLKQEMVKDAVDETEETVDSLSQQNPLEISLQEIDLTNFDVSYDDENTQTYAHIKFGQLFGDVDKIDLQKNAYALDELKLLDADIIANLYLPSTTANTINSMEDDSNASSEPIQFLLNELKLENVAVEYNNTAVKPLSQGFDYNHLDIDSLDFEMNDFEMVNNTFHGNIDQGNFKEKSGFVLNELQTDFTYTEQIIHLENLLLATNHTRIEDNIQIAYDNLDQLTNDPGKAEIDIQLKDSYIGFSDIRLLAPDLANEQMFRKYPNGKIEVNADIFGTLSDVTIRELVLNGPENMKVDVKGEIQNAMDVDQLHYDLNIYELSARASTIYAFVEPGTIPDNINIPNTFTLKGTAEGTVQKVKTDALLTSSDGNAKVNGTIDLSQENKERYDVKLQTTDLNIGRIIQNPEIGKISVSASAKGIGSDPETANADIQGVINNAYYNGYNYQKVNFDAQLHQQEFDVDIISNDPNANMEISASGRYADENSHVIFNGDITKLDVHKLGFYSEPLIIAGKVEGEAQNFDPDKINANITLTNFAVSDAEEVYPVSDANLEIVNNEEFNKIEITSSIVDATLEGKYQISEIFSVLEQTINSYYQFTDVTSEQAIVEDQYFDITATVKDNNLIQKFLPDLEKMEEIKVVGSFNADQRDLQLSLDAPYISYMSYELNDAKVEISNSDKALNYQISLEGIKSEDLALNNLNLNGEIMNNQIGYHFQTKDDRGDVDYLIGGILEQNEHGHLDIHLSEDELVLDHEAWTVAPDNTLTIADTFVTAQNFMIQNGESKLSMQSVNANPDSPLQVDIMDFGIETLTRMVKQDSLLAQGTINGTAVLKNPIGDLKFDAELGISDLKVYGSEVGNLDAKLSESSADRINTHIVLSGFDNNAEINGFYDVKANSLDMDLNIQRLNMASLQGFTLNEIQEGEGYFSGSMKIEGDASSPQIIGNLDFNDIGFFITQLGTKFQNINDNVKFNNTGIEFNSFTIYDESSNEMQLDGEILTKYYSDFAFDLRLDAENFKLIDAEKEEDQMLYGVLAINTNLVIKGDMDLPIVTGNLEVDEPTDFTYIMPQSSPSLKDREGVVRFVDRDQVVLNETIKNDSIDATSDIQGLDVSVNITVQPEAKLSMIIDQATGDLVKLQGSAELTGSIDPSGKTSLTGIYEVEEGAYKLNYSFIQRDFEIVKGSTITWTGDPMEAILDLTAIYEIEAAPIDLLEQQISGLELSRLNQYKQRIPFNTILNMDGDLMKPELTFDITLDEDEANVASEVVDNTETKLSMIRLDQNEINKQVFSLLLLNRFMGENPFASDSGLSPESMARQSVSRILSDQLNNLASDLIKGVDINFDLQSKDDYTSGEKENRTNLNVSLSKRLLNDRLKVTIGNNFGVEGEARENEEMANIAGDITLDYSLSKDGTYVLRAYRTSEYQVALQGQVIETGVGFIMTLEYNEFKEIMQRFKNITKKKDKE